MSRSAKLFFATAAFLLFSGATAGAQRVLGPGDDAAVLPTGVFRLRILDQWTSFDQRYGKGTPGRADGALEPLGVDFTLDTIGVTVFPNTANLQAGLRSLTGMPNFGLTLGNTVVKLRDRVTAIPFVFEAGITKRFSMGLVVPYIMTHSGVSLDVNTAGNNGNVGFNPALAVPAAFAQDTALVNQFSRAAATLSASLAACQGQTIPQCTALNASRTTANSLIASSSAFAGGISQIYTGSPFVPVTNTEAQLAIEARVAGFKSLYQSFGVNAITSNGPFAAQNRLTVTDAQKIVTNPAFGVSGAPLESVDRSHIGDIDFGGKFELFDSFNGETERRMSPEGLNARLAIGGIVRFPTGQIESDDNFIDIGTGRKAFAVEGRVFTDVLVGRHFWQSFIVRYNHPLADKETMRIIDRPDLELAPLYRRQVVNRALGNTLEFETNPRWVLNDFFAVSGQYIYRHKSEDHYTGTFNIPGATTGYGDITINAATLNLETEQTESRFGGGLSFSNIYAFEQGKAKIPFEVTFLHQQTTRGSGGNQPKFFTDQIQLRLYARIFGGSDAPAAKK
ncbi:MAG: hypothetical protein H0W63_09825 [Gemmatimonadaceae bacterium]|nr:hypothetical protein [Gemmatimonadaceae bacterium]